MRGLLTLNISHNLGGGARHRLLLIPGTSSVAHLRENLAAAKLTLPGDKLAALDQIAGGSAKAKR